MVCSHNQGGDTYDEDQDEDLISTSTDQSVSNMDANGNKLPTYHFKIFY